VETPKTLIEAVRVYSNLDTCHQLMVEMKWPNGEVSCPKCGGRHVGEIKSRRMFQCKVKECRKQFSVKVGTIFEESPLGLDKWLVAVWCITNDKNGISSCEVARALGVTQKTAWFMLHRVRVAMAQDSSDQISGVCESDETFIGGAMKNMHKSKRAQLPQGRGTVGKAIVHGVLNRTTDDKLSQVRLKVVPNQKRKTLQDEIKKHVKPGIVVYTDALASYEGLDKLYVHEMIDHAVKYVEGEVHTNGMENFWSLLKRMLGGTYVSVAPKHLTRYCAEEAFRFNERGENDSMRFQTVMKSVTGKRLTYKELTEKPDRLF
jgi:transposase-like protein